MKAENRGIEISLEVAEPMKNPAIPLISYIRILSILFDNAIEGALESENPKIAVANFYQDGDFVFIIENSTREKSVDLSKIFQRGYSTKVRIAVWGLRHWLIFRMITRICQLKPAVQITHSHK